MTLRPFRVEGEFMATDIDDALDFLARHFASAAEGRIELGGAAHIFKVEPVEDSGAGRGAGVP